ncbi:MAG: hypothetical protein ACREF9_05845 [Opitutaceae bacterium]
MQLYRRTLARQSDGSVTMIAVGSMDNLVHLLNSPPDAASDLSGTDLIRRTISILYVMAPYFNRRGEYQKAWNFTLSPRAAVEFVRTWPTVIKFGEGNLGHHHSIGARLRETPTDNPVSVAFEAWSEVAFNGEKVARDRHCADPTTVLYAVCGTEYFNEVGPGSCDVRQNEDDGVMTRNAN